MLEMSERRRVETYIMSTQDQEIPEPEKPYFTIGDTAQFSGISEATLRVWERRYHFPFTTRTTGGHRLYSQRMVIQLQWIKMQLDEGMRVSHAIYALHHMAKAQALASTLQLSLPPPHRVADPDLAMFQQAILRALLSFDADTAGKILDEAAVVYPVKRVALEVIRPTLVAIGKAWCSDQLDVATEHFASNYLRHHLLGWMRADPPAYQVSSVVLACAPGELHEGSLLILGALLHQLRWPVVYLGQSLPLADLASLTSTVRPSIIVFVAMSEAAALALADWPSCLAQVTGIPRPIVGYGGQAFTENPQLSEQVPGVFLGSTLEEGIARLHRLLLDLNSLRD